MQIHSTKGIVLRSVKYGETSVIATIYTELFGTQTYLVKGVYTASKKGTAKSAFFQPAALLDLQVYHNELKQLQFVKEFQWAYLYKQVYYQVVHNTIALYIVEVLMQALKQPEPNTALFAFAMDYLQRLDALPQTAIANVPLQFTLQLGEFLGIGLQGVYTTETPILDLQEGMFVAFAPSSHRNYLDGELAAIASRLLEQNQANLLLNRSTRNHLIVSFLDYLGCHIPDFGKLKSYPILQEVLG